MEIRTLSGLLLALAGLLYGLYGCAAEAQPQSHGAALQGAAGTASDADRDVDEQTDETNDRDDDVDERHDEEFELQLNELPEVVQATARAEVGTGTITGIERDRGPTGIETEIEFVRDGVEHETVIAEDGTKLRTTQD